MIVDGTGPGFQRVLEMSYDTQYMALDDVFSVIARTVTYLNFDHAVGLKVWY